jgi:hypothetical protein
MAVDIRDAATVTRTMKTTEAGGVHTPHHIVEGELAAGLQTNRVMSGTTALTPKFAVIDHATSGDNTIVAAVGGKKIRVLSLVLVAAGTVNVRFESGTGGTALTGQMNLIANTGFALGFSPVGHFETATGALLNLELSAGISVDGCLVYVEV